MNVTRGDYSGGRLFLCRARSRRTIRQPMNARIVPATPSCAMTTTPPRMRSRAPATVAAGPVLKRSSKAGATLLGLRASRAEGPRDVDRKRHPQRHDHADHGLLEAHVQGARPAGDSGIHIVAPPPPGKHETSVFPFTATTSTAPGCDKRPGSPLGCSLREVPLSRGAAGAAGGWAGVAASHASRRSSACARAPAPAARTRCARGAASRCRPPVRSGRGSSSRGAGRGRAGTCNRPP